MRYQFLINLVLTFIWVLLTGSTDILNFFFGFALSFLVLWITFSGNKDRKYFSLLPQLISFGFFFLYELFKANIQVAFDVITVKHYMKPGIVKYPLDATTDVEITFLANLISLTPGTLSLDVSCDKKVMFIHAMYVEDEQEFIDNIKNGFERRLLKIMR
jgi:multicomponent Na+:H+ antiporter subunit E